MQSGVSLYKIYCGASLAFFLYYPHKVAMMQVTRHFSCLPLSASVFLHCQNSDKTVRVLARGVLSSAVRQPTALCANHNQRAPPLLSFSPPIGDKIYDHREKNYLIRESLLKDTTDCQQFNAETITSIQYIHKSKNSVIYSNKSLGYS